MSAIKRLILAVENLATMDGRVITETELPTGGIPVLGDRPEGGPQVVLGWVNQITRVPAPGIAATIVPGAFYLLGTPDFSTQRHRGLSPQADFSGGTTAPAVTPSGLEFTLFRGAKMTSVVLGKRPAWMGMEIQ